jgi:hypothetical protein
MASSALGGTKCTSLEHIEERPSDDTPPMAPSSRAGAGTIVAVDVRVKTFAAEAAARLAFLCQDLGFVGPEVDDHGGGYPVVISLRFHRPSALVEVSLVLAYGGEEYVTTTLVVDHEGRAGQSSEVGSDTARTGFQMRRALDRHASALRRVLAGAA